MEEHMKAQQQIHFLSDLLNIIQELQDLVQDYCRLITAEEDGCCLEEDGSRNEKYPF
jgi:hypothetical protein